MNRMMSLLAVCLVAGIISPQTTRGEEPALPELKPLNRFVGSWKTTMEGGGLTGKATTQWVLGGRFIQQKYSLSDGSEGMNLRGYDPNTKQHVMFTFDSRGTMLKQEGAWDNETNTLTVKGKAGVVVVITKAHFPDEDTEEWSIIVQDEGGNVLQTFKGTNVRTN